MTLNEYNYSNNTGRKLITTNAFISYAIAGFIFIETLFFIKSLVFYRTIAPLYLSAVLFIMLLGNIIGKTFFNLFSQSRIVYIVTEFLFIAFTSAVLLRNLYLPSGDIEFFLSEINNSFFLMAIFISLPFFFLGIKNNYFVKVSSGIFIDEKTGSPSFLFFIISGFTLGTALFLSFKYFNYDYLFNVSLPVLLLPFLFLIKEKYNPKSFIAKTITDSHEDDGASKREFRDDILFNYLNFTYVIIYLFLSILAFKKFHSISAERGLLLFYFASGSIMIGFILSILVKKAFWHIYSEMLYPFLFIIYYAALSYFSNSLDIIFQILFIIPLSLLFGFTLYHSMKSISHRFNQQKAYKIINISLFILPIPIIFTLALIPFNNRWFFILFYCITALNLIIPGLHLLQRNIKEYKKGLYFVVLILTIPVYIVIHMYFKIIPNDELLIKNSVNYESIYKVNYNSDYIPESFNISIKDDNIITINNNFYQNQKKALQVLNLYIDGNKDSSLFIDGNRKFIYNTSYRNFINAICLNYIPDNITDYNNLPVSGEKEIITINKNILFFFKQNPTKKFDLILLNPNNYDLKYNGFLFSNQFLRFIKNKLTGKKVTAIILPVNKKTSIHISEAIANLSSIYKNNIVFSFGNQIMILSSDYDSIFSLTEDKLTKASQIADNSGLLFFNSGHLLLHNTINSLKDFQLAAYKYSYTPFKSNIKYIDFPIPLNQLKPEFSNTPAFYSNFSPEINKRFEYNFKRDFSSKEYILSRLIKAEEYNLNEKYTDEISELMYLKKVSNYRPELRKYINNLLDVKKDSYIQRAWKCEVAKEWEKASELYNAVLSTEKSHFEATYRLGLISMTTQDFESAANYFNKALSFDKSNADVMYQLGIINFAQNKYKQSLEFFKNSLTKYKNSASVHFYIGMCYEQYDDYGNFLTAKKYYKNALALDPNNEDITSAYDRINEKIDNIKNNWNSSSRSNQAETEEGEKIPIPINQRAINSRLDD